MNITKLLAQNQNTVDKIGHGKIIFMEMLKTKLFQMLSVRLAEMLLAEESHTEN